MQAFEQSKENYVPLKAGRKLDSAPALSVSQSSERSSRADVSEDAEKKKRELAEQKEAYEALVAAAGKQRNNCHFESNIFLAQMERWNF